MRTTQARRASRAFIEGSDWQCTLRDMTFMNRRHGIPVGNFSDVFAREGRGLQHQRLVELRPASRRREQAVLDAVSALPAESLTPSAAVTALLRQGLDIPHSTLAQILRRLERKGVIRLGRRRS
jgi:hypothetical protein